jgi:hypothetical protein
MGLLARPTATPRQAGIGRVGVDDPDAGQCRCVGDEGPEWEEGPTVQYSPPAFPNRSPSALSNPLQVFTRNPTLGAFRRADNGLGQTMGSQVTLPASVAASARTKHHDPLSRDARIHQRAVLPGHA